MRSLLVTGLLLVSGQSLPPHDATTVLARARDAVGGVDALARVESLHIAAINNITPGDGSPLSGYGWGDWLGPGIGTNRQVTHAWLAPPSRFLQRTDTIQSGFDGDRAIGTAVSNNDWWIRSSLWRWALPLLLYDPAALGLTVYGEWDAILGNKATNVVEVGGPGDFDMRLYFDSRSNRLLMTQFTIGDRSERDSYSEYKRVRGVGFSIELPFRIRRDIEGSRNLTTIEWNVVQYQVNPKDLDRQFK